MRRLPGELGPAPAVPLRTKRGAALLLDAGAETDGRPGRLLQFAAMGAAYGRLVLGVPDPRVGRLSPGDRRGGPSELAREALPLLKYGAARFAGSVDAEELEARAAEGALLRLGARLPEPAFGALRSALRPPSRRALRSWVRAAASSSPGRRGGATRSAPPRARPRRGPSRRCASSWSS